MRWMLSMYRERRHRGKPGMKLATATWVPWNFETEADAT